MRTNRPVELVAGTLYSSKYRGRRIYELTIRAERICTEYTCINFSTRRSPVKIYWKAEPLLAMLVGWKKLSDDYVQVRVETDRFISTVEPGKNIQLIFPTVQQEKQ